MEDLGRLGLSANVYPELTRANVIDRLRSGEYKDVVFIHHVVDGLAEDVTHELVVASEQAARAMESA